MEIAENLEEWGDKFAQTWLAHFEETGERDFATRYKPVRNHEVTSTDGVDLAQSKLLLITSAGSYLKTQEPYDMDHRGDYSIRTYPNDTPFDALNYIHHSYDTADVTADPNTLLPFDHLRERVADGRIGSWAETVISFMGYQPDLRRVVNEMIPAIVAIAQKEQPQAALLVPS